MRHLLDQSDLACSLTSDLLDTVLVGYDAAGSPFFFVGLALKFPLCILLNLIRELFCKTVQLGTHTSLWQVHVRQSATNHAISVHIGQGLNCAGTF